MAREFQVYIVPTPIGNLGDITFRAIETLKSVDIIACEDTRTTQKLLNHYEIKTKCYSYHKYNEKERINFFKNALKDGMKIALVSDAGTPLICDPGAILVEELLKEDIAITSLPGACAITTFLSQIPRYSEEFSFIGFAPRTSAQIQTLMKENLDKNIVFYDAPERIIKTLTAIKEVRGDIKIALGRELSKLFEEINVGSISEIIERYHTEIKGEIVCMIYKSDNAETEEISVKIEALKAKGFKAKEIATILATLYGENKNKIYELAIKTIDNH